MNWVLMDGADSPCRSEALRHITEVRFHRRIGSHYLPVGRVWLHHEPTYVVPVDAASSWNLTNSSTQKERSGARIK